ncbi:MAG: glycoside hydrolase family 43 protein [Firmicutes bacterium]|nr:glycoside hydrolase family 43 protein [Bacillota bacterium]
MAPFSNPILPGSYPDPSICRVGSDYFLVTSSFEYFPGVPIFHSRDLVHWHQIGHVLDRPTQLNLNGLMPSRGIWAATIRHHASRFYVTTTLVLNDKQTRNFFVYADDPAGPWSDPVWINGAEGIDPTLVFDGDRAYYLGNGTPAGGQQYPKHRGIWLQEIDLATGTLFGPRYHLWEGALKGAQSQEGPHLYKVGPYYYLLIAEGGTGFAHAVTVARSQSLTGPYLGYEGNPILTHRHLGRRAAITNVGHGDLVETPSGEWWMVCLASRPYGGDHRILGRETFLVPVVWEQGWPVVNPPKGVVELKGDAPALAPHPWSAAPEQEDFDTARLGWEWNFLRTPREPFWSLEARPGYLRLRLQNESLSGLGNPSAIVRRQQHASFAASTALEFIPQSDGEWAGLVLINGPHHFRLEYGQASGHPVVQVRAHAQGEERIVASTALEAPRLELKVQAQGPLYSFFYRHGSAWVALANNVDGTLLSMDSVQGFVGAYLGLFVVAESDGVESVADFDWFCYQGLDFDHG